MMSRPVYYSISALVLLAVASTSAKPSSDTSLAIRQAPLLSSTVAASSSPASVAEPFNLTSLAASFNLTSHWSAPLPSSLNSSLSPSSSSSSSASGTTLAYLSRTWQLWNSRLYGGDSNNLDFVQDPFASLMDVPEGVLKVEYEKGSYKQSGGDTGNGGATFYASPTELGLARRALLSYQVAFDPSFDFVKGGKLPGFWSGSSATDCSGGQQSQDGSCFSVRMMWRTGGLGEVYTYLPQANAMCDNSTASSDNATPTAPEVGAPNSLICNDDYGTSIGRGSFSFARGSYTNVTIYIQLNTPSLKDGVLKVWSNGSPVVDMDSLVLRDSNEPLRIFFSTFFGGSTADWASTSDTRSYFKNLEVWMDTPVSDASSSARSRMRTWTVVGTLVILSSLMVIA